MRHYVLDEDNNPVRERDLVRWRRVFGEQNNTIKYSTVLFITGGAANLSTIFLGLDYSTNDTGLPILYETRVFGGALSMQGQRYSTLQEALDGHNEMCGLVQESLLVKE